MHPSRLLSSRSKQQLAGVPFGALDLDTLDDLRRLGVVAISREQRPRDSLGARVVSGEERRELFLEQEGTEPLLVSNGSFELREPRLGRVDASRALEQCLC